MWPLKGPLFSKTHSPLRDSKQQYGPENDHFPTHHFYWPRLSFAATRAGMGSLESRPQVGDWVNPRANLGTIQKNRRYPVDKRLSGPQN